jgi:hypothetical protein
MNSWFYYLHLAEVHPSLGTCVPFLKELFIHLRLYTEDYSRIKMKGFP